MYVILMCLNFQEFIDEKLEIRSAVESTSVSKDVTVNTIN